MTNAESARRIDYLEPISTESPTGVDARLEPEHELLRGEITKLSAVQGCAPDWAAIESAGGALLAAKSKDLLVAAYVACALCVRYGVPGAVRGAALLTSLLSRFGSALFPLRTRARVFALAWYLEWLRVQLDATRTEPLAEPPRLVHELHQLRDAARQLLAEETPCFVAVLRSAERIELPVVAADAPRPQATPTRVAAHPAQLGTTSLLPERATGTPLGTSKGIAAVASAVDQARHVFGPPPLALPELQSYVARAGSLWVELARSRFEADRTDPRSYRWLRAGLWLRWERLPMPNRRGRTDLDGPSPARQAELSRAAQAEHWDDLLRLSEQSLVKYPLWLDLNRLSALALDNLGDRFALARAHVERDTHALVARLPALSTLAFSDGVPFACSDTVGWLMPVAASTVSPAAPSGIDESLRERLQHSERSALAEVEQRVRTSDSGRTSFLLRLELASALEGAGQLRQAAQLYLGLERDIDTFRLERWEPELALRVLRPLWKILCARDGAPHADADRVAVRLAQLSPTALL